MSISRDKLLEHKAQAFQKFMLGILKITKLNFPQMRAALDAYLRLDQGLVPEDASIIHWLSLNTGSNIGVFIIEDDKQEIFFKLASGTPAELRMIGEEYSHENRTRKY